VLFYVPLALGCVRVAWLPADGNGFLLAYLFGRIAVGCVPGNAVGVPEFGAKFIEVGIRVFLGGNYCER